MSTPVLVTALTNTVKQVVGAAAILSFYEIYNPNGNSCFVQFFDAATPGAVTLGTTVPVLSLVVPPLGAINLADLAINFASGIQVAATTGATGAFAVNTPLPALNFSYR